MSKFGAMQGARGCIASVGAGEYLVSVAWQGVQSTGPAPVPCGNGAYSNENLRRGLSTVVRIGTLS